MKTDKKITVSYLLAFLLLCTYLACTQDSSTTSLGPLKLDSDKMLYLQKQLQRADGKPIEKERSTQSISLNMFLGIIPYADNTTVVVNESYSLDKAGMLVRTGQSVATDRTAKKDVLDYSADVIFTFIFYMFWVGLAFLAYLTFKPSRSITSPAIWTFDMALFVFIIEQWSSYDFAVGGISIWAAAVAIGLLLAIIALSRSILSGTSTPSLSGHIVPALSK